MQGCRFYNRVSVDDGFEGMGLEEEAERLASRFDPSHRVQIISLFLSFMDEKSKISFRNQF